MEIIERAPAKINLGLDVLHKRVDGYHEVESIFASVDLADHLTFENLEEDIIRIETDSSFLPVDRRNHVYQAVDLLKRTYNIHKGIKIYIEKRIPVAAGLAGGSSDCAAALRGLNKLWNLGLTMDELCEIGSQIGMDVPYCLRGGTAFANGRGENALESVTIARHPIVQQIKDRMLKYGADAALMSGSGPTVFALCEKKTRAQRIYNGLKGFCEEVYLVRTLK